MKKGVYILKNFPAARAKWSNLNKFDTNEIFPLRGLKRYEILEEKGICIQKKMQKETMLLSAVLWTKNNRKNHREGYKSFGTYNPLPRRRIIENWG